MSKKVKTAADKAALEIYFSRKLFSPEVKVAKDSIDDYCIAQHMTRELATLALLRSALAQFVYMYQKWGFNRRETKAILKRTINLIIDSIEIKEEK